MELTTAINLIQEGVENDQKQVWADLGAGTGLFTQALSSILKEGSTIYAVDIDSTKIELINKEVNLFQVQQDFEDFLKQSKSYDGILMANSLHYVKDKLRFFEVLKESLNQSGRLLIVEYDTDQSNPWVPYPLPFESLENLAGQGGFNFVKKIGVTKSQYQRGGIYSALIMG